MSDERSPTRRRDISLMLRERWSDQFRDNLRVRWPDQLRESLEEVRPDRIRKSLEEVRPDRIRKSLEEVRPDRIRESLREPWTKAPDLVCKLGQEQQERTVGVWVKWETSLEQEVPEHEAESGEKRMATREELESIREKARRLAVSRAQQRKGETAGGDAKGGTPQRREAQERARSGWSVPSRPDAQEQATGVLEWFAQKVPPRISNEEIGDALEAIHIMVRDQRPVWCIYLKAATTFFWVGFHTLQHHVVRLLGIVKLAMGQGDDRQ